MTQQPQTEAVRTPGEWYTEGTREWGHVLRSPAVQQHKIVAQGAPPRTEDTYIASHITRKANAEAIVTAVNSHDALVEAARAIVHSEKLYPSGYIEYILMGDDPAKLLNDLAAALKLAEG